VFFFLFLIEKFIKSLLWKMVMGTINK